MKKIFLIFAIAAALLACNNASETESTKGNSDTTDTTSVQDHTINRDTAIRIDSNLRDTNSRKDASGK